MVTSLLKLLIVIRVFLGIEAQLDALRQTKSKEIIKYMNLSADPCDDFYEFTCGNYKRYYKVDRDTQPIIGTMDVLNLAKDMKIKDWLESKDDIALRKSDMKVKSYYRSCLRAPKLKSLYRFKLRQLIKEIGCMPLLEPNNWLEDEFVWSETIVKIFCSCGIPILVQLAIDADYLNSTINRLYLLEALPKPKIFYSDRSRKYHDIYLTDMGENLHKFLGVKADVAKQAAKEIFEFEKALSAGMLDDRSELQMTELYPERSVENLTLSYLPMWNVEKFLDQALGTHPRLLYIQQSYLDVVVNTLVNTPKHIVANYIFYNFIKKFFYPKKDSIKELQRSCRKDAQHFFYKNLDNIIYRKFLQPQIKEFANSMWHDIKASFAEALQKPRLSWIQETTRLYTLKKLKDMRLYIATYEDLNFDEDLGGLHLKDHDYIYNKKSILRLQVRQLRTKLQRRPTSEDNLEEIASLTPMYMAAGNFVSVPVSYLQPDFAWSSTLPAVYNFANLGFSLAHEMIHAFDDGGRYYDVKGVYNNWWDSKSASAFDDRVKCFFDQYRQYSMMGQPIPEMHIQSENIADNGGVRIAYESYLKWLKNSSHVNQEKESYRLFNFTGRQLFFISFGQMWCSVVHPDYLISQLSSDSHVPDKFRVIGPLSNFEEFSAVFKCPKGTAMNPATKCSIY